MWRAGSGIGAGRGIAQALPSRPTIERSGSLDIAIVGCGPAGMAAALFLSRAGHRIRLFERFDAPRPIGAGLLLQPTGLAVLARLGLGERIAAAGARIDRLDGRVMPSGRRILEVAYADLGPSLQGVGIHRASLFDALHDAVLAAKVDIAPAHRIVAIEAAADHRPILVDGKGVGHGPFDLAVDASGAQSALRAALTATEPRPFPYGALWTTVPLDGHDFDPATLSQRYVGARRMVGVMPVGLAPGATGNHAAFFWSIRMDRLDEWRVRGLDPWKAEVAAIWPEALALIAGINDPLRLQPAFYAHFTARVSVGPRLALIGDAAHSTSPQLGQGANMALLDAMALADGLARHAELDEALLAYAATRRAHTRFYQAASYWLTPLFQSDSRAAALVRDIAFPAMRRVPHLRRETVRTLAGLKTGLWTSFDPTRQGPA
jgi:salicylate hydroxylase